MASPLPIIGLIYNKIFSLAHDAPSYKIALTEVNYLEDANKIAIELRG